MRILSNDTMKDLCTRRNGGCGSISAIANSQTTTGPGTYTFGGVRPGRYCVKVLVMSYASARSDAFTGSKEPVTVLRLAAATTALKEVTVTGTPPMLEQHADRIVLNVLLLNTAGETALEILKKAPGVTLDKDDNLVYRDSTGVNVLIDGKLTYLSGAALSSYLKSLPASSISQIELMPNPPTSLDAAGTADVLNIKLRRSQLPGLSGTYTLGLGQGRFEKSWVGTNLSYNAWARCASSPALMGAVIIHSTASPCSASSATARSARKTTGVP